MSSKRKCPHCPNSCDIAAEQCLACSKKARRGVVPPPGVPIVVETATPAPPVVLAADRTIAKLRTELSTVKAAYHQSLNTIEQLEAESSAMADIRAGLDTTLSIVPKEGSGTSEATPVIMASDWHSEELVTAAQSNGRNVANPDIIDARITRFFQASANLMKNHLNPGVAIHDVVVFLGGDFITNDIHEELVENVAMPPTEAIIWVQNRLVAGIDFYLNHTPYTYTFICRVGNHSRTTKKTHFSQENGHSLEHLMYVYLAGYYRNEPRVRFVVQDGYHIYFDVYATTIRFHHGHAVKFGGGVGGITIPVNKAVAQWDKARPADLDCFGHFHQTKSDQKWKCNGSLIGYNSFAVTIKGDYEPPRQTMFLVDKKRGVTCDWPILVGA